MAKFIKEKIEIGRIEKRKEWIRERRSELVELIHPYQKELDDLGDEYDELVTKQNELIKELRREA